MHLNLRQRKLANFLATSKYIIISTVWQEQIKLTFLLRWLITINGCFVLILGIPLIVQDGHYKEVFVTS